MSHSGQSGSFRNSVLLYRPSISMWTARKMDKEQGAEVIERNNAVAGSANVYKALLPDNATLIAIRKWSDALREFIYMNTAPWEDGGWRAGRIERHMAFMDKLGDRMRAGEAMFDAFEAEYATAREQARFQLNHMFKDSDYPSVREVRSKFSVTVDVRPVPNADDFRICEGLPPAEVDKLVQRAQLDERSRFADAQEHAAKTLLEVVEKFAVTLKQFKGKEIKKFNDTLSTNIADVADAIPALNITGDARIDALAAAARELTAYDLADLRKNDAVRDAAIREASTLAQQIKHQPLVPDPQRGQKLAAALADMLEA